MTKKPEMYEPVTISVRIGEQGQDYQGGNLLNAIDEVVCYYQHNSDLSNEQIASLLNVYAGGMGKLL